MAKKTILKIQLPAEILDLTVIKTIKSVEGVGFIAGTELEDHALWMQKPGEPLKLTGTLKEEAYNRVTKAKTNTGFVLSPAEFEWINTDITSFTSPLEGSITTLGSLKLSDELMPAIAL